MRACSELFACSCRIGAASCTPCSLSTCKRMLKPIREVLGEGLQRKSAPWASDLTLFAIYIIRGLCAALSLLQSFAHERFGGAIIVLFCAGAWIGVQHLGYAEFEMARRIVLAGNFRRRLNAELQLSTFREDLASAVTPDQCWEVLQHITA